MGEGLEVVLGEIPVVYRLEMGSERLILFPTNTRIIVARVGKRGAGAMAGAGLLGRLSGALEDLFKGGRESLSKRGLGSLSPEKILVSDRNNFSISYSEVVSVEILRNPFTTSIMLLTHSEKLEFSTRMSVDRVVTILGKNLGSRLAVKKR
jgi:hypothetical protein